jgi:predicted outer membrane repeat protein
MYCTTAAGGSTITANDVSFTNNLASGIGGAIFGISSTFTMNGYAYYGYNAASIQAGAVFMQGGTYTANGEHTYEGNLLTSSFGDGGGCYYQTQATVTYNNEVKFVKNVVQGSGGGVAVLGSTLTFNKEAEFEQNSALRGDNLYIDGRSPSTVVFNGKSNFESVSLSTLAATMHCSLMLARGPLQYASATHATISAMHALPHVRTLVTVTS